MDNNDDFAVHLTTSANVKVVTSCEGMQTQASQLTMDAACTEDLTRPSRSDDKDVLVGDDTSCRQCI